MTTETPSVIGIVLEREHTDGTSEKTGKAWNRYSFQIAGGDGKHYYTSFDQKAWNELEKNKTYQVFYALRDNTKGGFSRDIQWWKEAQLDGAVHGAAPPWILAGIGVPGHPPQSDRDEQKSDQELVKRVYHDGVHGHRSGNGQHEQPGDTQRHEHGNAESQGHRR